MDSDDKSDPLYNSPFFQSHACPTMSDFDRVTKLHTKEKSTKLAIQSFLRVQVETATIISKENKRKLLLSYSKSMLISLSVLQKSKIVFISKLSKD